MSMAFEFLRKTSSSEKEKERIEEAEKILAKKVIGEPLMFGAETSDGFAKERFFKEFNIKPEELDSIEGYNDLADGQKYLVLDNLRHITIGRIKEEAVQKTRGDIENAGFWERAWHGVFKNYHVADAEKESAQELIKGGIETHGAMLTDLVEKTRENGISSFYDDARRLHYTFTSKIYVRVENAKKVAEEAKESAEKAIDYFNVEADDFSSASVGWEYKNKKGKEAQKIKERYENARSEMIEKLKDVLGEEEAIAATYDIDRKVRMQQLMNESPDAEQELKNISSQWVWSKALKNTLQEKGGYMAMGAAARTITTSLLGVFAAPLVAAGMGAWVARQRAIASLREEAILARGGKINVAVEKSWIGEKGETEKETEKPKQPETVLNFVKAENLKNRLETLMRQIDKPKDKEEAKKRDEYMEMLQMRLDYTEAKIQGGLVNYGETGEQLGQKYDLLDTISRANTLATLEYAEVKQEVEDRLNKYLAFKEKKISKKVHKQMLAGAVVGAGFAGLGYALQWGHDVIHQNSSGSGSGAMAEVATSSHGGGNGASDVLTNKNYESIVDSSQSADVFPKGLAGEEVIVSAGGKVPEIGAISNDVITIKHGGNLWEGARSLVAEKHITEKQFTDAWQHSTVKIDGHDVPISKVGLVHEGDQLQYVSGMKGSGYFDVINKSGDPLGDDKALYEAMIKEHGKAPEWLKHTLGIIEKKPDTLTVEEIAARVGDLKPNGAALADLHQLQKVPSFLEIPASLKEVVAADDFQRSLPNLYCELDTHLDHFGDTSLLQQESTLAKYANFLTDAQNYQKHAGEVLATETSAKMFEKTKRIFQALTEEFNETQNGFWSVLKKLDVTEIMYKKVIGESKKLSVGDLEDMLAKGEMHEKWGKFAEWVLKMKPKDEKMLLDTFVRGSFKR